MQTNVATHGNATATPGQVATARTTSSEEVAPPADGPRPLHRTAAIAPQRAPVNKQTQSGPEATKRKASVKPKKGPTKPKHQPSMSTTAQQAPDGKEIQRGAPESTNRKVSVKPKSAGPAKPKQPSKPMAPQIAAARKTKAPPPHKKLPPSHSPNSKVPPSHRASAKGKPSQTPAAASRPKASPSQETTIRRSNVTSSKAKTGQAAAKTTTAAAPTKAKDSNSWDGNSNTTPDMEPTQAAMTLEGPKRLYKVRRKYAAEDLKKRFDGAQKVNAPPLTGAAAKAPKTAASPETNKEEKDKPPQQKKILKVFRI